jgi:hypothetical protein
MAKSEVKFGQIYCPAGQTYLSRSASGWAVRKVFTSHDGLPYAQLVNQRDSTLIKTVSVDALTDPHLFQLAAQTRRPNDAG